MCELKIDECMQFFKRTNAIKVCLKKQRLLQFF